MKEKKVMRGMITDEIQSASKAVLGYKIGVIEFRLMPYVQYELMNGGLLMKRRMNQKEINVLKKWQKSGFVDLAEDVHVYSISVTQDFWKAMNHLLWFGYAAAYEFKKKESKNENRNKEC